MRIIVVVIVCFFANEGLSQMQVITVEQAIQEALKNNESIKAASFEVEAQKQLKKTSFDLPKAQALLTFGQYNSFAKTDNNITLSQTIPITVFGSQAALNKALVKSSDIKKSVAENDIVYEVKQVYYQFVYANARHTLLLRQDSIYEGFLKSASLRYKTGETNLLEQTTAEVQRNEVRNAMQQNASEIEVYKSRLKTLLNVEYMLDVTNELNALEMDYASDTTAYKSNPSYAYMQQQIEVAHGEKKVQSSKFVPDLLIGFFSQTLIGAENTENRSIATKTDRFVGFQAGISIPLWIGPFQGRARAAEYNKLAAQNYFKYYESTLQSQIQQTTQRLEAQRKSLTYYESAALPNAELILKQSLASFKGGQIGYAEYLLSIRNAIAIQEGYLKTLHDHNQTVIYISYLTGKKE